MFYWFCPKNMKAFVFPDGKQFSGMGKDLHESSKEAKDLFELANKFWF